MVDSGANTSHQETNPASMFSEDLSSAPVSQSASSQPTANVLSDKQGPSGQTSSTRGYRPSRTNSGYERPPRMRNTYHGYSGQGLYDQYYGQHNDTSMSAYETKDKDSEKAGDNETYSNPGKGEEKASRSNQRRGGYSSGNRQRHYGRENYGYYDYGYGDYEDESFYYYEAYERQSVKHFAPGKHKGGKKANPSGNSTGNALQDGNIPTSTSVLPPDYVPLVCLNIDAKDVAMDSTSDVQVQQVKGQQGQNNRGTTRGTGRRNYPPRFRTEGQIEKTGDNGRPPKGPRTPRGGPFRQSFQQRDLPRGNSESAQNIVKEVTMDSSNTNQITAVTQEANNRTFVRQESRGRGSRGGGGRRPWEVRGGFSGRGRGRYRLQQLQVAEKDEQIKPEVSQGADVQTVSDGSLEELQAVDLPQKEYTPEELEAMRKCELEQLKRRFNHLESISESQYKFNFTSSDPDWPFDVKSIRLQVTFPETYPAISMNVTTVNVDDVLPDILVGDLDTAFSKWISFYHRPGRLSFRPFLKWLDRNMQEVFIESLKKIKKQREQPVVFVAGEESKPEVNEVPSSDEEAPRDDIVLRALPKKHEKLKELDRGLDALGSVKEDANRFSYHGGVAAGNLSKIMNNYDPSSPIRKGVEIKFRNVDLSESIAILVCDRLFVSVQCKKCKKLADFNLSAARKSVSSCEKCQTKIEAIFRPGILHQVNPVLGYLELSDCIIRDVALSRCHFYIDCLQCSKLSPAEGLHLGQKSSSICLTCNTKRSLLLDSLKYFDMCLIDNSVKTSEIKKANKDPTIQAGKPLPNNGACKHFKKSFRWFRFPCCGKAYPCDDCHNEQEDDHDAEFASRMICGYCAKEQAFSNDKPCSQCYSLITGRRTAHWEGGTGCRSKVKMSSNDRKKYVGMSKTLSRNAQNKAN